MQENDNKIHGNSSQSSTEYMKYQRTHKIKISYNLEIKLKKQALVPLQL